MQMAFFPAASISLAPVKTISRSVVRMSEFDSNSERAYHKKIPYKAHYPCLHCHRGVLSAFLQSSVHITLSAHYTCTWETLSSNLSNFTPPGFTIFTPANAICAHQMKYEASAHTSALNSPPYQFRWAATKRLYLPSVQSRPRGPCLILRMLEACHMIPT